METHIQGNHTPAAPATGAVGHAGPQEAFQLVSFQVGGEHFGIDILHVQEIIRMQQLTRVPKAPAFIDGVINVRGRVIPVVGLRRRLGWEDAALSNDARIIVLELKGTVLGITVDSVSEVLRVRANVIEAPPRLTRIEREYVAGIARLDNRLLLILDLLKLLSDPEHDSLAAAAKSQ